MRCCLRNVFNFILGVIALLILLAALGYFLVLPQLDRILADAVRREYMLPPSATVYLKHGTLMDTWQGKVRSFLVEAKEARLEGLRIENVELFATGIQFDIPKTLITRDAELRQVDRARLSFRVSEDALAERWGGMLARSGISKVDVDLHGKEILVSGTIDLKLTKVRCSARGNFNIDDANQIRMEVSELSFGGANIGLKEFKDMFSKSIRTPLLDLGGLKMGVKVTRLEPKEGYLLVEAESEGLADLADAMKREAATKDKQPDDEQQPKGKSDAQKLEDKLKDVGKQAEDLGSKLKDKLH